MGTSIASVLLGVTVLQMCLLSSYGNHLGQIAATMFSEITQRVACGDGSCDLGRSEPDMVTSMPVNQEEMSSEPHSSLTQEEILASPYLDFCLDFVVKKDSIAKNPETKDLETDILTYIKSVLALYEQNPDRRDQIIVQYLQEIIDALMKTKLFFESEISKQAPVQPTLKPIVEPHAKPPVKPCVKPHVEPTEEIIAEVENSPPLIGSVRGIPGVHYPNYSEVPITSFSCGDKAYIPGFYADMETRCQVFHVCYAHRRESFLCPIGTTFNQPILACDYWYSSNCSLSSHYYDVNAIKHEEVHVQDTATVQDMITTIIEQEKPLPVYQVKSKETELDQLVKFLPVKSKILEFPKPILQKPVPAIDPKLVKVAAAIPAAKAKLAIASALPALKIAAAKKLAAAALAVDAAIAKKEMAGAAIAKKKVAGVALGINAAIAKKKISAAPVVKAGIVKTKMAAAAIPVAKATLLKPKILATKVAAAVPAAALPVMKAKAVPLVKAAVLGAPILKAKKAAMISPLTKKALALGYIKLLKAKKLALMG